MEEKLIIKNIISFLEINKKIPKNKLKNIKNFEYLHENHIDSLDLINLILFLEKKFKIKFTIKNKESMDFRTVGGLTKIIKKKLK